MHVLENDFLNSFLSSLHKTKLYNLSSGKTVQDDVKSCLLTVFDREEFMANFKENLTDSQEKDNIFTPITLQKWLDFAENKVKAKLKINGKLKDIVVQRDVFRVLAAK